MMVEVEVSKEISPEMERATAEALTLLAELSRSRDRRLAAAALEQAETELVDVDQAPMRAGAPA